MRIQVYKCRITGKLYTDRTKFTVHLQTLRQQRKSEAAFDVIRRNFNSWLTNERAHIYDVNDIIPWFLKNQQYIMAGANALMPWDRVGDMLRLDDEYMSLSMNARYNAHISNSHTRPDNGVTNGCRTPELPISYQGFEGSISGKFKRSKHNFSYPYTKCLNLVGLKTTSGGGGNNNWTYGVHIFLNDWPGLAEQIIVNKLQGVYEV